MKNLNVEEKFKIVVIVGAIFFLAYMSLFQARGNPKIRNTATISDSELALEEAVIPPNGAALPIRWGDLGYQMVKTGVIDAGKFKKLYTINGELDAETEKLLSATDNENIKITSRNSRLILNLLWALGLGNKNEILEKGPMITYSGAGSPAEALAKAGGFASTGGWTLAVGSAMDHYSKHLFIALTPEQQKLVELVSQNIYRPCCGNSTYFPDCNHGMAMLGLLELMASQGVSEKDMYKVALQVNSYWFPDTYLTIAKYLKEKKNIDWEDADPKEILGANYSSASGYQRILKEISPPVNNQSGSCGI